MIVIMLGIMTDYFEPLLVRPMTFMQPRMNGVIAKMFSIVTIIAHSIYI